MPNAVDAVSQAVEAATSTIKLGLIAPEIVLLATGIVAMMVGAFRRDGRDHGAAAVAGLGTFAAFVLLVLGMKRSGGLVAETAFSGLLVHDPFALFFKYLFLVTTLLVILLSWRYLEEERASKGEYYSLLCFATVGMMLMASGRDLVTIYVGLELMALSIYVLVGFLKSDRRSNEAAMKYFILGAFSSAFFVYGISLFYGITGRTSLEAVQAVLATEQGNPLATLALILIAVGLAFKVAAVPFHAWAPDAYEGAPTPITAYVSVASKSAAFAILLRILLTGLYDMRESWSVLLWVLAAASMTLGNVVAVVQDNVKRMLAYSSIAHAGYALLGVLAASAEPPDSLEPARRLAWARDLQEWAQGGTLLYLFAYTFMNLGAFALVTMMRRQNVAGDDIKDFRGLFHREPAWAVAMALFLLSLGGIPPTAGFVGKLVLFGGAMKAGYYALAVIAVLNTAVSIYFYFRIVVMMWMEEPDPRAPAYAKHWMLTTAVLLAAIATLGVGLFPGRFIGLAQRSVLEVPAPAGPVSGLP